MNQTVQSERKQAGKRWVNEPAKRVSRALIQYLEAQGITSLLRVLVQECEDEAAKVAATDMPQADRLTRAAQALHMPLEKAPDLMIDLITPTKPEHRGKRIGCLDFRCIDGSDSAIDAANRCSSFGEQLGLQMRRESARYDRGEQPALLSESVTAFGPKKLVEAWVAAGETLIRTSNNL